MPVTVDLREFLDAWAQAWERDSEDVTVLFHQASHPTLRGWRAQLEAVDRAVVMAMEVSERTNQTDVCAPAARHPVVTEEGVALTATAETVEGATLILRAIASALDEQGWTGQLSVLPHLDPVEPGRFPGRGFPAASLIVALSNVDPRGYAQSPWVSTQSGRTRLVDLALDLVTDREGEVYLFRQHVTTRTTLTEVCRLLDSALERDIFLVVQRSDRTHLVWFTFGWPGHLILQLRTANVLFPSDAEQLRGIARDWASDCDFAAMTATYRGTTGIQQTISESPAPTRVPAYYNASRELDQELVPDAFPWQILTGRHLERAHDLSSWSVTEVAPDRYEVSVPELAVPHLDQNAARRLAAPTEAETHQARLDFGPMINTRRP